MQEIDDIIAADESGEIPEEEEDASSWTIEDGAAIKQTDRHVFLYRETIVAPEVLDFFGARGLEPGRKRKIVLWYGNRRFDAHIEKTMHTAPRVRMLWKADFGALLAQQYPGWLDYFTRHREESGDTPPLRFTPRAEPGNFDVELEGAVPAAEEAGEFAVPFEPGDTIDNDTLHLTFRCSLLGPMRRSQKTASLVLISDHTKSAYEDKWIGKVFHFTGMGVIGEQSLASRQNRTLEQSRENGVRLFLFEVFCEGKYVYMGEVELMDKPYRSRQPDSGKTMRDVWVFPLCLRSHKNPPLLKTEPAEPVSQRPCRASGSGAAAVAVTAGAARPGPASRCRNLRSGGQMVPVLSAACRPRSPPMTGSRTWSSTISSRWQKAVPMPSRTWQPSAPTATGRCMCWAWRRTWQS
jgi:5-methylcytosine-specific restriction protein A